MALSQKTTCGLMLVTTIACGSRCPRSFSGTPLYSEEGGDILKGRRDLDAAKRLLAESGYAGETVTSMAAQDNAAHKAWGDVTADLLRRIGMKVDYAGLDWGSVVARRAQKSPPGQGGWQLFHTYFYGVDCVDPTSRPIRANGDKAFFGWPNIPQIEAEVAAWYEAKTLDEEKVVVRRLNKAAFDNAIYAPLGLYLQQQAWRTNVKGVARGRFPCFGASAKPRNDFVGITGMEWGMSACPRSGPPDYRSGHAAMPRSGSGSQTNLLPTSSFLDKKCVRLTVPAPCPVLLKSLAAGAYG